MLNLIRSCKKLFQNLLNSFDGFLRSWLKFFVGLYRTVGSQYLGGQCRFYPTCSHYALEALETHRTDQALVLISKRILKCHPFSSSGWDPVPARKEIKNERQQHQQPVS